MVEAVRTKTSTVQGTDPVGDSQRAGLSPNDQTAIRTATNQSGTAVQGVAQNIAFNSTVDTGPTGVNGGPGSPGLQLGPAGTLPTGSPSVVGGPTTIRQGTFNSASGDDGGSSPIPGVSDELDGLNELTDADGTYIVDNQTGELVDQKPPNR